MSFLFTVKKKKGEKNNEATRLKEEKRNVESTVMALTAKHLVKRKSSAKTAKNKYDSLQIILYNKINGGHVT